MSILIIFLLIITYVSDPGIMPKIVYLIFKLVSFINMKMTQKNC